MQKIDEEEAVRLAGDGLPRVIAKVENNATQSAICLKKLPFGFLLGVSSETKGDLQLYTYASERSCHEAFQKHVLQMDKTGYPFLE